MVLDALHATERVEDLNMPGFGLHALSGDRAGTWAIVVTHNWRITFTFEGGNASHVDYEDHH